RSCASATAPLVSTCEVPASGDQAVIGCSVPTNPGCMHCAKGSSMPSIRSLRRNCGLTIVELALQSGIPARTLGAIEYGLQVLDHNSRARLADILGVPPELLVAEDLAPNTSSINPHYVTALTFALTGALLLTPLLIDHQQASEDRSWGGATKNTVARMS